MFGLSLCWLSVVEAQPHPDSLTRVPGAESSSAPSHPPSFIHSPPGTWAQHLLCVGRHPGCWRHQAEAPYSVLMHSPCSETPCHGPRPRFWGPWSLGRPAAASTPDAPPVGGKLPRALVLLAGLLPTDTPARPALRVWPWPWPRPYRWVSPRRRFSGHVLPSPVLGRGRCAGDGRTRGESGIPGVADAAGAAFPPPSDPSFSAASAPLRR